MSYCKPGFIFSSLVQVLIILLRTVKGVVLNPIIFMTVLGLIVNVIIFFGVNKGEGRSSDNLPGMCNNAYIPT